MTQPYARDLAEGAQLPVLEKRPTTVALFRFSAATWNPHRIHYDTGYARQEGYDDILVQSHLHGCFLTQLVTDWMGPDGTLLRIGWQNRGIAYPGEVLRCTGTVTSVSPDGVVELALEERAADGRLCAPGTAVVRLPLRPEVAA